MTEKELVNTCISRWNFQLNRMTPVKNSRERYKYGGKFHFITRSILDNKIQLNQPGNKNMKLIGNIMFALAMTMAGSVTHRHKL